MAAKKYYAWSVVQYDADVDESGASIKHKRLPFGSEVTAKQLGVDEENFDALVEAGSIRDYPPPDMPKGYTGSPLDYLREQAAKATEGVGDVALSMGGSYFGPNEEDILMDPEGAGALEPEAEPEEKSK